MAEHSRYSEGNEHVPVRGQNAVKFGNWNAKFNRSEHLKRVVREELE